MDHYRVVNKKDFIMNEAKAVGKRNEYYNFLTSFFYSIATIFLLSHFNMSQNSA